MGCTGRKKSKSLELCNLRGFVFCFVFFFKQGIECLLP